MRYVITDWERQEEEGSLESLLGFVPGLMSFKLVPPLTVLNDVLARGSSLSNQPLVEWEPFRIADVEYERLARDLSAKGFRKETTPPWVEVFDDWLAFGMNEMYGVPIEEHRSLLKRIRQLESLKARGEVGTSWEADFFEAQQQYGNFISSYLREA